MHTRERTGQMGRGTDCAEGARAKVARAAAKAARAGGAWPRRGLREGSGSGAPEWRSVARSPGRRAAEAAMHSRLRPEGEKL
jgi:hypothetical protein